jgi:ribosome-associated protein
MIESSYKGHDVLNNFELEGEVYFVAVRSRGPGGQNVNKVSSAAILYWNFSNSKSLTEHQKTLIRQKLLSSINSQGELYTRSDEFRDLRQNKSRCLEKLKDLLALAFHKPKKRTPTRPTGSSKIRKRESKGRRSETKKMRAKIR